MLSLCECINTPIKSSKIEGPATFITFLGIHLDTIEALLADLNQLYWHRKTGAPLFMGKLSISCKVVPSGRIFLSSQYILHHHLPLTQEAKLDMKWW